MLLSKRKTTELRLKEVTVRGHAVEVLYTLLRAHLVASGKMTRHQLDMWEREVGDRELARMGIKIARVQTGEQSQAGLVDPSGAPVVVSGQPSPLRPIEVG